MNNRAKYLIDSSGQKRLRFFCPGCKKEHIVRVQGEARPNWTFNGNLERPTLSPSIMLTTGHYVPGHRAESACWCTTKDPDGEDWGFGCGICHSFVRDGQIQFLGDSTHTLAGKIVDLPVLTESDEARADGTI